MLRLKEAVRAVGTQDEVAEKAGVSREALIGIFGKKRSVPGRDTLEKICEVLGVSPDYILQGNSLAAISEAFADWPDAQTSFLDAFKDEPRSVRDAVHRALQPILDEYRRDRSIGLNVAEERHSFAHLPVELVGIPALNVKACAGDGSFAFGEELGPGPFQFATDWLRRQFGQAKSLRMIQITGDSQEPDLKDGDWVMIDEAKNKVENGLHVIRLDDCLMIKRLHREGHFLQLISRNPIYAPTVIDLSKEEDRLAVIGKAVYVFKGL